MVRAAPMAGPFPKPGKGVILRPMGRRRNSTLGLQVNQPSVRRPTPRVDAPEVDDRPPEAMDAAHRAAVAEGRAQFRRGEVATDAEIESAFSRFGT